MPRLALANNLWLGHVPMQLSILMLPERILVARYFPAGYIVKLYPKIKSARRWNSDLFASGIKGNVSTYPLPHAHISSFVDGHQSMPPVTGILSALIGVTFIQPNKKDGVPEEIIQTARVTEDMNSLAQEESGYVPEPRDDDDTVFNDLYPNADCTVDSENGPPDGEVYSEDIPLQSHGVVDANGNEVIDEDLREHALSNGTDPPVPFSHGNEHYKVKRGSHFVNEYGCKTDDGLRTDGGPSNPNHLMGAFPVLFPYGIGGFETAQRINVPYEVHAHWALQYGDHRFRKDLHFVFQVFGVIQKRNICRSAVLQMLNQSFQRHQGLLSAVKPKDLIKASLQEKRKVPFTNPAIQVLRTELTAVQSKVHGTDESRQTLRSKIWSTTVIFNPPNLWLTINPNDTQDPIAQVIAGEDIDLDDFISHAGPNATLHAKTIAADPYASAKFFHLITECTLSALAGIQVLKSPGRHNILREEGIFGTVQAYIGTVEAQGCGSLHMHVLLWLRGSVTSVQMDDILKKSEFHEWVSQFISQNIVADIGGLSAEEIIRLPELKDPSYSRPPQAAYDSVCSPANIAPLARTLQVHVCHDLRCLIKVQGRKVCKRRAPFPQSPNVWIDETGEWGPKHLYGYVNNFNPPVLVTIRSNHDIKLITNAYGTSNMTWYIMTYATKKQNKSSNASALLAKAVAFHKRSRRLQEFSAQEAIGYVMGWGDRYVSHHYVPIYMKGLKTKLLRTFPSLRPTHHSKAGPTADVNQSGKTDDTPVRLEFREEKLQPRDQVQEYVDHGEGLQCLNLFDFIVNTYDIKKPASKITANADGDDEEQGEDIEDVTSPNDSHFDYLPNCGRQSRTRAV
ncbi:hypothetical protein ARMSODRAFT_973480 [Armillaria solidipes]|uniref:Uncharacterized protein n=1 Tax=Armillaria solidipes TaxID=1076256 RepID=A0A2H3BM43_9AGAR|nr:hypothetical protein ARMSODRAFT_973480 [Armillaria solidipes]